MEADWEVLVCEKFVKHYEKTQKHYDPPSIVGQDGKSKFDFQA